MVEQLIAQACEQQRIAPETLTVHADRGSSMTSKPVAMLLADLGVTKTHSRPYTSTDNPYSEAQFKTLKYRPRFPQRFDSIEHARAFCREFFGWYNGQHRHSGIGPMTPATVHHGRAHAVHTERARVQALLKPLVGAFAFGSRARRSANALPEADHCTILPGARDASVARQIRVLTPFTAL